MRRSKAPGFQYSRLVVIASLFLGCTKPSSDIPGNADSTEVSKSQASQSTDFPLGAPLISLYKEDVAIIRAAIEGLQVATGRYERACREGDSPTQDWINLQTLQPLFIEASSESIRIWLRPRKPLEGADENRKGYAVLVVNRIKPACYVIHRTTDVMALLEKRNALFSPCSRTVLLCISAYADREFVAIEQRGQYFLRVKRTPEEQGLVIPIPTSRLTGHFVAYLDVVLSNSNYEYEGQEASVP